MSYTREALIEFLWSFADRYGYAPRTTHLSKEGYPPAETFRRRFDVKTWAEVIDAAGLTSMVVDPELPHGEIKRIPWDRDAVIDFYQRIIHAEKTLPVEAGYPTLYKQRRKFFPGKTSERDVVEAAGFDYPSVKRMSKVIRQENRIQSMRADIKRRMGIKS